ncbi:hypothetical protein J7K07_06185 [Candidatus Bathyarchaeota archaeon]|nr:hypothetical protein [Candidatus Bathyarchaeota archaeon]
MPPTERTLEKVRNKAGRIWKEEGRPFCYLDFPEYKPGYFRKITSLLSRRGEIVRWKNRRSRPQYWILASEGDEQGHGESSKTLLEILDSLNWENLCIHDVRISLYSRELCNIVFNAYPILRGHAFSLRKDGSIVGPAIRWGKLKRRKTKAVFYPSGKVIVEVSCSREPIPADEIGLRFFIENLIDLRRELLNILYRVVRTASIPLDEYFDLPESWIVVQVHLNRDASPIEGLRLDKLPAITLSDFYNTLRLYYNRKVSKMRAEIVANPKIPLRDFFKRLGLRDLTSSEPPSYIA